MTLAKGLNEHSYLTEKNFSKKNFLTLADFSSSEISYLLNEAAELKKQQNTGIPHPHLKGKTLGMIFEKSSTRTRVSFEVGMLQLGGNAIFLSSKDIQLGRGESIEDTAKVLSRYVDGLMIRTFAHESIEEFAKHSLVPVINGLTDLHHPTQVLADLLTIKEHKGKLEGLKICYIGDGNNNMCHSLLEGAVKTGMDISVSSPAGYEPNAQVFHNTKTLAQQQNTNVDFFYNPYEAVENADVIITDVWASMGQESEQAKRIKNFKDYQVNSSLCSKAKSDFIFLHCLPAHRGEEVTGEIIDGPHSHVFDEAENRLHAQKALLKFLMG